MERLYCIFFNLDLYCYKFIVIYHSATDMTSVANVLIDMKFFFPHVLHYLI